MYRIVYAFCISFFIALGANAEALSSIRKTQKLFVCIWPEYYGISYIEPRTQMLIGLDVDLAKALAHDLNVDISFVQSSFATLINDLNNHRCDIAMFAIGQTPERAQHLQLTQPHLASDIYAIATKSNQRIQTWDDIDQKGVIVAVAKGTLHVKVMQERLKYATLSIVESLHAREQEVEAGRADVFMTDYPFGMRMIAQREWAKLIRPTQPFHITPYGWALRQNEPEWLSTVEAFIVAIKNDGRLERFAQKHSLEPIIALK